VRECVRANVCFLCVTSQDETRIIYIFGAKSAISYFLSTVPRAPRKRESGTSTDATCDDRSTDDTLHITGEGTPETLRYIAFSDFGMSTLNFFFGMFKHLASCLLLLYRTYYSLSGLSLKSQVSFYFTLTLEEAVIS